MGDLLRHTVATLAYRAAKAIRDAPAGICGLRADARRPHADRDPGAHGRPLRLGDPAGRWQARVAQCAAPCRGTRRWQRFFGRWRHSTNGCRRRAADRPGRKLFQGPIADALTHVGQLAMLRRMAGCKIRGENYFKAANTLDARQRTRRQRC